MTLWNDKIHKMANSLLGRMLGLWFGELFVSQSFREFYTSHFLKQMRVYAETIYQYCQILIYCIIPSGSPFPPLNFT